MAGHIITTPEEEIRRVENLPFRLPLKLRELLDGFKWATREKNTSAVIVVDGKSGKGKTTLSAQIGAYCDKDYLSKEINLKKIHWHPDTFLNGKYDNNNNLIKIGLKQAQPQDVIIFDEAMLISSRSAMSEINKMVVAAMSMIRSKKIIVIFNVNSFFDLDKNLSIFRSDLLLHCYGSSLTDRGKFLAFFQGADDWDRITELYIAGKKHYSYKYPDSNFNAEFPSLFVFDEVEYEEQKQKGVSEFLQGDKSTKSKDKVAKDRLLYWMSCNTNLTREEISKISKVSVRSIQDSINRVKLDLDAEK